MADFDIENFELNKNYVIEASAGTGKTYNIIEIVGKLLKNEVPLNKILIVTYTDKACSELRNRIKEKLIAIQSNDNINNAEIYTIHSFCKTTIEEFPISGNFNTDMNLIDDSYISEFADIYIRKNENIRKNEKCLELIKLGEYEYEDLKDIFINFTKSYYLDKNYDENTNVVSYGLKQIKADEIEEYLFLKHAESLEEVLNDSRFIKIKKWYDSINRDLENGNVARRPLTNIKSRIERFDKYFNKGTDNHDANYDDCWEYLNDYHEKMSKFDGVDLEIDFFLLKDFYIQWIEYKKQFKLEDFNDMIRLVHEEVLNNEGFVKKLKEKLKDKYTYVIIDEFQDTNQLQYDIFKTIFLTDDHYMIVVGDPKQSIYSFQGTDLTVYNKAKDDIVNSHSGLVETLSKNYRTSPSLVEGVNKLIEKFKDPNNPFNSFNDFTCSSWVNNTSDNKEFQAYIDGEQIAKPIWIATDKDDNGNIKVVDEDKYSDIVASKIVELCAKNKNGKTKLQLEEYDKEKHTISNVSFKDFAVLCRTRTELDKITYKFKKYGIPYLQYKDSSLFKGRECAHFKAILEAIVTPDFTGGNRSIYRKALYTDFFGWSLKTINTNKSELDDTDEMKLILKWKKKASKYDWAELIDSLLNDSKLRENNSGTDHMQSLFNYIQIAQYILNDLTKGNNLNNVIKKLNDLSKYNSSDDDEENSNLVERSTDFDCVKIMTMHASKGLEFPIVISAGGLKGINNQDSKKKAFIHHEDNKAILTIGRYTETEEVEEIKRLFYVAYTRAKYLLIAPLYKEASKFEFIHNTLKELIDENSQYINTILLDENSLKGLKGKVKDILSYDSNNSEDDSNDRDKQKLIDSKSSQLTHKHSYSSLSHSITSNQESLLEDENIDNEEELDEESLGYEDKEGIIDDSIDLSGFDTEFKEIKVGYDSVISPIKLSDSFPRGNRIGTILHEVFEKADFKDYSNIDDLIKESFKHEGLALKDEWINDVKNIVDNVLKAKLKEIKGSTDTDNIFSLNELDKNVRQCEIEFNFNFKKNTIKDYCNGFIDLIFQRGEYYSVLDWKSDSLNEEDFTSYSNFESLSKHTAKHYAIQRVLYSYTLVKYLNQFYPNEKLSETFNNHFGGIYYVYLKGCNEDKFNGIYCQTWNSFEDLEKAYNKIVKVKIDKGETNGK